MDYNEWYYKQYLDNYYKNIKTNSTKLQKDKVKLSKSLKRTPNSRKNNLVDFNYSFNSEGYSQTQLDYYQAYVSKFHPNSWNQPQNHTQTYTEYGNDHIFHGPEINNAYYYSYQNNSNDAHLNFNHSIPQTFLPKSHKYDNYKSKKIGVHYSTDIKRVPNDRQPTGGKINIHELNESTIKVCRFNNVILSNVLNCENKDHGAKLLPGAGFLADKKIVCHQKEIPLLTSISSSKVDLLAKQSSRCTSVNHSPKLHDVFISNLSPDYSDIQNELQKLDDESLFQNDNPDIEAVVDLEKLDFEIKLGLMSSTANLIDDSPCDKNIDKNMTIIEPKSSKSDSDSTFTTSKTNSQKITIRLPSFQFLKDKTSFDETQANSSYCDKSINDFESIIDIAKLSKKTKLSKEELRTLKLARRETDCQVIYGAEEANTINVKYMKNNASKSSGQPIGFRNYITRHLINKISNCESPTTLTGARKTVLTEAKNQKKEPYKLIENKKKNQNKNSHIFDCSSLKKSSNRSDKLSVNLDILALDRWGIWCEARITQLESNRALIQYKDVMVHRKEWISLGVNRIKLLEEDTLSTPTTELEVTDSPSMPIDTCSTTEISNTSSPSSPMLNKFLYHFGNCSNCGGLFEQFRYYCLHCPEHDFVICKSCYLDRFPKKHLHSRLVFSKECTIASSNIEYYLKKPFLKNSEQLDRIQSMIQDKVYSKDDTSLLKQKTWSASLETRKIQRPGILGLHRFLPNSHLSFKPNLIICIFCHSTQHISLPQKGNIEFSGDFISLENPFILPPSSRNIKLSKKLAWGKSTWHKASQDNSFNYIDLFWCHINCAKFSSNVFIIPKADSYKDSNLSDLSILERFDFYNLSHAVRLGNRHRCPRCREKGATVACEKPGCVKHYHLQCTGKPLEFFERGQVFYCRSHETVIKKILPLTNVIGSISCIKCGGLLPQGRKDDSIDTKDKLNIMMNEASDTFKLNQGIQSCDVSQSEPEKEVICAKEDNKIIKQNELIDTVTVDRSSESSHILPSTDSCLTIEETPDSTWSWYTCQECITNDDNEPFDLCQNCFKKDLDKMNHVHDKAQFRWTNYHDVANDSSREAYLFKSDDAIEYNINRPNVSEKQKLILYMNLRKRKEATTDETIQKEDAALQCAYCWDTSSKIWRKGYAGVLLCGKCFEGIPHEETQNNIEKPVKKKRKKVPSSIQIKNKAESKDHNETSKELFLTNKEPQVENISTENSNIKESSNLVHQYLGEIEDYSHFPYYTRIICNDQNFNDSFSQAKFLDSYAPIESHWFSLLITSSYYDIPGRAPRWGSHSGSDYHGTWLPQTVRRALLRYTRPNEKILSNFLGRGTDAIECFLLKRKCFGVDINPVAISLSQRNCSFALPSGLGITAAHRPTILQGDSRDLRGLDNFDDGCFDHVLSHPPYKDCVSYSTNIDGDLSKFTNQEEFQSEMSKVIQENWRLLKMGGRLTLGIGDNREKCFYVPVSFQLLRNYLENGFELEELIVKRQRHCQMFGLGTYLSAHYGFLIFTHEYIFTLKKIPKNKKVQQIYRKYLRAPEEVQRWKYLVRIKRRRRAIPSCPVERQSVIMGTVWNFRPQSSYTFEILCKSRMVERFGKNGTNWEDIDLSFPKFKDELSDMKPPQDVVYHDSEEVFLSEYEKQRESHIKENSQKLLTLGLTVELGDERSEDITHYNKMSKLASLAHGELFLMVAPHIPNYKLVNEALPIYRKSITSLAQEACVKLAPGGFFIVGVQDYRIQDLQGGGLLVPLSLLVFEDIERMLKSELQQKLKLKEMVICVPDGFQCQKAKEIFSLPIEPSILDIPSGDPFPNLPLVHATYIIYMKL